jgi:hypothetical protein
MPAPSVPPLDFLPADLLSQPVVLVPDRGLKPHQCTSRPRLFVGAAVDVRARRGLAARCRRARRRRGLAERDRNPGIRRIASLVTPRQRGVQPRLLTLTAAALERSTASPAEQVFACTAIGARYSPNSGSTTRPVSPQADAEPRRPGAYAVPRLTRLLNAGALACASRGGCRTNQGRCANSTTAVFADLVRGPQMGRTTSPRPK